MKEEKKLIVYWPRKASLKPAGGNRDA